MKSLEKSGNLTTDQYKKIKAIRSRPEMLYGVCKAHKLSLMFVCYLDLYLMCNVLKAPKLSSVMFNEFTVKDSFPFAEGIVHQEGKFFMGKHWFWLFYHQYLLKVTIIICTNLLHSKVDVIEVWVWKPSILGYPGIILYVQRYSLQTKGQWDHGITLRNDYGKYFLNEF